MLDRLHSGLRKEMNIGDQRDVTEPSRTELTANLLEAFGRLDIWGGDTDDFAADLGERDRLPDGRSDVLRVTRGHRLDSHRIGSADADRANEYFASLTANGLK